MPERCSIRTDGCRQLYRTAVATCFRLFPITTDWYRTASGPDCRAKSTEGGRKLNRSPFSENRFCRHTELHREHLSRHSGSDRRDQSFSEVSQPDSAQRGCKARDQSGCSRTALAEGWI